MKPPCRCCFRQWFALIWSMPTLFGDHLTVKTKSVQSGYREEPRDWLPASEVVRMRRDSEFSICRPCTTVVAVVITTVGPSPESDEHLLCVSSMSGTHCRLQLSPPPASTHSRLGSIDTGHMPSTIFTPTTEGGKYAKELDMTGSMRPCGLSKFRTL